MANTWASDGASQAMAHTIYIFRSRVQTYAYACTVYVHHSCACECTYTCTEISRSSSIGFNGLYIGYRYTQFKISISKYLQLCATAAAVVLHISIYTNAGGADVNDRDHLPAQAMFINTYRSRFHGHNNFSSETDSKYCTYHDHVTSLARWIVPVCQATSIKLTHS